MGISALIDKAVFKSFKHNWNEKVIKYWIQFPDRNISKERCGQLLTPAWIKSLTIDNKSNGFRATGIYSCDPTIIKDEAFAPSERNGGRSFKK